MIENGAVTIESVEILAGVDRAGEREPVERIRLSMGEVASVIGPTGSGKTALITDIELFADRNTPSKRKVLINGASAPAELVDKPSRNPIAMITQHTNFLSDLPVDEFLSIHSKVRGNHAGKDMVGDTLDFANQLTGEPVNPKSPMTQLSGGQTRALLIADAVIIGRAPILLLDEIENAGINRSRALELLRRHRKIFIFVTHDPRIALLSDLRVVMAGGGIWRSIRSTAEEKSLAEKMAALDDMAMEIKRRLWEGQALDIPGLACALARMGEGLSPALASFAPPTEERKLIEKAMAPGRVFEGRSP